MPLVWAILLHRYVSDATVNLNLFADPGQLAHSTGRGRVFWLGDFGEFWGIMGAGSQGSSAFYALRARSREVQSMISFTPNSAPDAARLTSSGGLVSASKE